MLPKGYLKEYASTVSILMRTLDIVIIFIAGLIAFHLVMHEARMSAPYRSAIVYAIVMALIIYPWCGIYQVWRGSSERDEIKAIFLSWSALFACLIGIAFLLKESETFSRLWAGTWYLCGLILWTIERMAVRFTLRKIRKKGYNQRIVAIIGVGQSAYKAANTLSKARWTGLKVKGFYTTGDIHSEKNPNIKEADVLGDLQTLLAETEAGKIDQIWIALPSDQAAMVQHIIHLLDATTVDIRLIPDLFHMKLLNHSISAINDLPVIDVCMTPMQGFNRILKALEDKVLATIILCLISPLIILISILIKATSPGPIFFKQLRHGFNGQPFWVYKFRSMRPHKEQSNNVTQATKHDKRITPVGSFLRRTSLDELPQFINVLKGEMSIVGPRPHALPHNNQYKNNISAYMKRHKVKPGITGLAQIHGYRGETDTHEKMEKRVEFDLLYIENWSLWLDLKIIFLTVFKGFINKNAY